MFYMPRAAGKKKTKRKAMILGVGLDTDGHKRLTTGENFALVGGTSDTHEAMTEKVIKINKVLESVGRDEFDDIAQSVGLRKLEGK
jgi:hypothetical protein